MIQTALINECGTRSMQSSYIAFKHKSLDVRGNE